jgi:hypothetical protein
MSGLEAQRILVKQLRIEASLERKNLSEVCKDLVKYCQQHQGTDVLVKGFASEKDNPYKEKSGCQLI